MPKINGNEIRPGNVLEHNGGLWAAVKVDHVKPGKGGFMINLRVDDLDVMVKQLTAKGVDVIDSVDEGYGKFEVAGASVSIAIP